MSDDVFIAGVGATRFGRRPDDSESLMALEAVRAALHDAGVERAAIDAVFVGNVFGDPGLGQAIARDVGLAGLPVVNVENACASGTSALLEAAAWIRAGMAESVLVLGVEKLSGRFDGLIALPSSTYIDQGLTLPAIYALHARRHMEEYGLAAADLAAVTVKARRLGAHNPLASYQDAVSAEEVLAAPLIADPLTRLMCCPNADGAAAAIVTGARPAAAGRPIRLLGSALASGRHRDRLAPGTSVVGEVARRAYEAAGVGPQDVDVAEVHDAFVIGEILAYERLGFCEPGQGGGYVARAYPHGDDTAVNTSGGLMSRGHPPGATGIAQVYEVVRQLRDHAGPAQVQDADVGLTLTMGGTVTELETNACVVHVFGT